jgi:hypothetical protein
MSMRLDEHDRNVLYNALVDHLENISGEEALAEEERRTRKLMKRLDDFFKVSTANRAGGRVAEMKARHKLSDIDNFLKGYTGKSYKEHLEFSEKVLAKVKP